MSSEQQAGVGGEHEQTLTEDLFERLVNTKSEAFVGLTGPKPSFPLGNAGDFMGRVPWGTLGDYAERHGSMCLFWFATSPQILVSDPDLVWRVLEGDFDSYYKDNPSKALTPILSDANAFVNNGEAWRVARESDPVTVAAPPPRNGGPAKLPAIDIEAAQTFVNGGVKNLLAQSAEGSFDLRPWMVRFIFDLFSIQAVGRLLSDEVFEEYLELTSTANDRMTSLYFLKTLHPLTYLSRRKFRGALLEIVDQAKKYPDTWKNTVLGMSLARPTPLDDETLATQLGNFFFGGAQSVPAVIVATLYCLARDPAAAARVRAEVKALFARSATPSVEELDACTELDHALLEAMRLYPPAPVYMRNTDKERTVELGGHSLPPDTTVFVCTYAMQRSSQHWSDPNKFVPERWANGGKERDPLGSGWYFPFGRGRRACLGQTIGLIDMKLVLATILAHGMPETEATYVEESYFGVLQPKTMIGRIVADGAVQPAVKPTSEKRAKSKGQAMLRQEDPKPEARDRELSEAREVYKYSYDLLPTVAYAADVPDADEPSLEWTAMVVERAVTLYQNAKAILGVEEELIATNKLRVRVGGKRHTAAASVFEEIKTMSMEGAGNLAARDLLPFLLMYQKFQPPSIVANHWLDSAFGRLRVAGPNPMELRRVTTPGENFPVTNAQFCHAILDPSDSIEAAGAEGRLYLTDYSALDGLPTSSYPYGAKYLAAPLGLFVVPKPRQGLRDLQPVAIQLFPRPGQDNPIFTPSDGVGWQMAKYFLNLADGHMHQAFRHFAFTHLVLEAFVVSTHRQLPRSHPLSSLLLPHFVGTLSINANALTGLISDEGGVDAVMSARIDKVRELVGQERNAWHFDDAMFEKDIAARGVGDADVLPYYPFRDDARLLNRAIFDWVNSYLRLYYESSADVQADTELQAWASEIASSDGGRVKGFGQNGRIETLEYLVDAVTHVIFTASVQHAAVNFPQLTSMTYAPGFGLSAYAPPPRTKDGLDTRSYMAILPPLGIAQHQLSLGYLLGSLHHTKLGAYSKEGVAAGILRAIRGPSNTGHFADERVAEPLVAFRKRLEEIEKIITEQNLVRPQYTTLLPSQIPEGINI